MTGGAGFIGSHLIDALIASDYKVRVIDNLSRGKLEFIKTHMESGNLEFQKGDLTSLSDVEIATKDIDCVFHLAANPDIRLGTRVTDTDLSLIHI